MAAQIARLRTKADRLRSDTAAQLRQLVLEYPGLPERARGEIIGTIDRQTASEAGWTFVMLSPEQNAAVMRWLREHSQRPVLALALWGELFTALRRDTGEVVLTRDELAERIGSDPGRSIPHHARAGGYRRDHRAPGEGRRHARARAGPST